MKTQPRQHIFNKYNTCTIATSPMYIGSKSYLRNTIDHMVFSGLGGLVVSALDIQAGYCGFESRSGRDNFQIISTPSSYSTCPGLSIKWTGRRLVTDSGTKCAWVIHESKAVQIHVHNNRRCLYVPRVPGSVKNPHNNNMVFIRSPKTPIRRGRVSCLYECPLGAHVKYLVLSSAS